MPEESTTPDLVELARQSVDAINRGDFAAYTGLLDPDAVWESSNVGTVEGATAVCHLCEDVVRPYEVYEYEFQEVQNLGNGVVFEVLRFHGRLPGSASLVQEFWAFTLVWAAGLTVRIQPSRDLDDARAAAERLAQERADVCCLPAGEDDGSSFVPMEISPSSSQRLASAATSLTQFRIAPAPTRPT
jgi:ketosteroid isomerase-like protein